MFTVGIVQDRVADPCAVVLAAVTLTWNGGKDAVALPSVALMVMLPVTPTLLLVGVPEISPVLGFRLAQLGKPLAEKVAVPEVVEAVGWNT